MTDNSEKMHQPGTSRRRVVIALGAAVVLYCSLSVLLSSILPGASKIVVTLETDQPVRFQLFFWNGLRRPAFQEAYSVRTKMVKEGVRQKVVFRLNNAPVDRIRLDIGETPGNVVRLYQLSVRSYFAPSAVFGPEEMSRLFKPGNEATTLHPGKGYVELSATDKDPFIVSERSLLKANFFLVYGIPLLVAAVTYLLLVRFDAKSFPAFADILKKRPSSGANIDSLDGLRGLAAMMVVADHTWGRCTGMGEGGVWIFMVLSGFLLARPFIREPARVFSGGDMTHFFLRRVRRILPAYYLYIIVIYVLTKRFDLATRHFLFLEGEGHLWVIPQEMFFYLLVPFIMILNYLLLGLNRWLVPLSMAVLVLLANSWLDGRFLSFYGMSHQKLPPYVGIFLSGILSSYLYHGYTSVNGLQHKFSAKENGLFSLMGITLLLFFILGSTGRLWGGTTIYSQEYYPWFGIAAGVLLFSIMAAGKSFLVRVLSLLPLRAIGLVSLSLYLYHPLVKHIVQKGVFHYTGYYVSGFFLFMATLAASYCVSCITYTYVEKPLLR